jgi:acetyl/propionyl-CoA carboxylase alpha subunit
VKELRGAFTVDGKARTVALRPGDDAIEGTVDSRPVRCENVIVRGNEVHFTLGTRRLRAVCARDGSRLLVHVAGRAFVIEAQAAAARAGASHRVADDEGYAASPMTGTVSSVEVAPGDRVAAGATLVVIEAMKMQFVVRAPREVVIAAVRVAAGGSVSIGERLVEFAAAEQK